MKINRLSPAQTGHTAEGAPAARMTAEQALRRVVLTAMLWEDNFYIDGRSLADHIAATVPNVHPEVVAAVAREARTKQKLRHIPLLIARIMAALPSHKGFVRRLLPDIIQRPDELTEFLAIYWKDGRAPLSAQVKRGLAAAFGKFDEYQLAKYNRAADVRLRDVLFLSHAKPSTPEQDALWKRLINNELATPDTWEVALSKGGDKSTEFTRLMAENKLLPMAYLRNLRNMSEAGVPRSTVAEYGSTLKFGRVLPFRFIAAARAVPAWEDLIEPMMLRTVSSFDKLPGRTAVLLDVSGSMHYPLSTNSDILRVDAAAGLAILLRELAAEVDIFTFSNSVVRVPPRRGFALRDAIHNSQQHAGTYLGAAIQAMSKEPWDRLIVLTDEQSHDSVKAPANTQATTGRLAYLINVAPHQKGVGYGGGWTHIDGWSEAVIEYIQQLESALVQS